MGGRLKKTYTITVQKAVKLPELSVNAAIDRVKRVTIMVISDFGLNGPYQLW
jgi:hypothetical protein